MERKNTIRYHILNGVIGVALGLIFAFGSDIFSACFGDVQRGGGFLCSPQACTWERSDGRCNDSSECCPGKRCNSWGYCEICC